MRFRTNGMARKLVFHHILFSPLSSLPSLILFSFSTPHERTNEIDSSRGEGSYVRLAPKSVLEQGEGMLERRVVAGFDHACCGSCCCWNALVVT